MNLVKIDKGIQVNGTRIEHFSDVNITSNMDGLTKFTISFYGTLDGVDNIEPSLEFKSSKNGIGMSKTNEG